MRCARCAQSWIRRLSAISTARCKAVGEFICDRIYELAPLNHAPDDVEKQACLTREEIVNYLKGTGYGWHISDLRIYDEARGLSEFTGLRNTRFGAAPYDIKRAPQSWCYVEETDNG